MSLLDKYTKKYGNVSRVNSLRKQEDWMPKTPMSDEKASNIRAAHQYMDSLTDDDKKRIMDESPLGKSAGYQGSQNGLFGIGKKQNAKEWETYTAAEDIINAEKYEKKRESVVRGYGKQAYDAMNSYLENKSWADEYGHLTKEGKDYLAQAEKNLSTLQALGIKGDDLKKYQQYISEYRDIKATEQREKEIRRNVQGSPVGMGTLLTAADVAMSPVSGFLASAEALKRPFYADRTAPVNTYGNLYALSNTERATEQAVSDQIDSNLGKFLYGAGVSTLKSAEAMAISKGLGNIVGIDAASKLGQMATLPIFGTSAFATTVKEAQDKGFSADKAVMKGLASGMAEMIFEELSLDKAWGTLQNAKLGKGGFGKRLLDIFMGAGIEGSEEIFTSLANHITDQVINGDFSDYQTQVRMNVENGMSLDEATRTAKMDFLTQLVEDGLAGALSGGFMNVGAATVGSINYHNTAKNVNNNAELKKEVVESAKGLDGTTAAEIANSKSVEQITENDMVEIIHSMEEATQRNAHDIAKETLVKMGESEESAEEKANAIVEMSTQENPTEEQEAKNIELVSDEKNAEAYTNVLKSRVAQNTVNDIYENNQAVGKKRKGGVNAYVGDKQIKVYDFADVAKGRVNTSVGVMSLSDAKMDENTGRLFRTAYVFEDTPTSNAYIENYKGQNLSDYSTAAMRAFVVGASGAKFETFLNDASNAYAIEAVNDNAFLQEMYFHGQNTAKKEDVATVDKAQAETKKVSGENALNPVFNEVAKAFNLNIETSGETSQSSGSFVPSLLKINLNEKESKNMYQTLHHELMEYSKAYAPKAYERLKGAVMDFATSKLGSPKVKMHLEAYRDTYRGFGRKVGDQAEASKNIADATDEYVNDFVAQVMTTEEGINQFAEYLSEKNMSESEKTSIIQSIKDFIQKIIDTIKSYLTGKNGMNIGSKDAKMLEQYTENLANIRDYIEQAWDEAREEVSRQLMQSGIEITHNGDTAAHSVRTTLAETWKERGFKSYEEAIRKTAEDITNQMFVKGESSEARNEFLKKAEAWVRAEESIASFILSNEENRRYLDYEADNRYEAIKKNADYPQGTVDFSNLCRKREIFTKMFDALQRENPDVLFTAADIADIREVLVNSNMEVACALCYVEDRRQKMGEIAETFIGMYKDALKSPSKIIFKTNYKGELLALSATKDQVTKHGIEKGHTYRAKDNYVPNQYDLVTYEGYKALEENHPEIAYAFERYNNSRGMASARLIEGHAEYKREILKYNANKVKSINNHGGLRISSFSDVEGIHIVDLMQVIVDAASKGIKAQAYTKVPEFAKIAKDTRIKINRSLIPANTNSKNAYAYVDGKWISCVGKMKENGIATIKGKEYLAVDIVEGIDVTNEAFLDDHNNPNVGNIIIGISDKQIELAMKDPNVDYIIPFHTNQSHNVLVTKGINIWDNYKDYQTEKWLPGYEKDKTVMVNIYTDVIDRYHPTNIKEFEDAFRKECARKHLEPRFSKWANTEGYYKLLIDFKLFDRLGNILPQQPILPTFDEENLEYIKEFLTKDKERSKAIKFSDEVMSKIKAKMKENGKKVHSLNVDSDGRTLTEDQERFFSESKIRDDEGHLKQMYHGTDNGGFTVFDPSKSDDDLSFFFSDNPEVSKTYTKEHPTEFNPYLKDMDIKTAEDAIKYLESRGWKIEEPKKTDDGSTKWTYHYPGMGKATCTTESLIEHAREFQKSHKAFIYPVYLNVTNPYVLDAKGNTWRTLNGTDYEDDYQLVDLTIEEVDEDEYEVSSFEMDYDETMSFDRIVMRFGDDIAETVQKYGGLEYRNFLFNNDTKEVIPNDTRTAAMYAYYHGYDGVMINNVIDNGSQSTQGASNIAVVFESNQIKSIYNEHPTEDKDIRYSVNVDSEGKELTENQVEFFKDSKARDENGNLLVLYHGSITGEKFYTFELGGARNGRYFGDGFYFTPDKKAAEAWGRTKEYGRLYKTYLNLKNPLEFDYLTPAPQKLIDICKKYIEEGYDLYSQTIKNWWGTKKGKEVYVREQLGETPTTEKLMTIIGHMNEERELRSSTKTEILKSLGYDGIIYHYDYEKVKSVGGWDFSEGTQYVAFYPNQIKNTTNKKPTEESNDIRHSLDVEDWEADFFAEMTSEQKEVSKILTEGLKSLDNIEVNKKITDKIAREIKAEYKSRINTKTLSDSLQKIFAYMLDSGSPGYADIVEIMKEVGRPVIEQATEVNQAEKQMYDHLMETLKTYKIRLNDSQKAEVANTFGTYYGYKNALFGKAVFSESGSDLDGLWTEIVDASSGLLDYGTNPADQPMALYEIIEALKPSQTNLYGADQEEAAYDVALSIFRKFLVEQEYENNPKLRAEALKLTEAQQNFKKRLKENYEKRYKEETESLRREREMNMKRLASEIKSLSEQEADALKGSIEQAFLIRQRNQYEYRLKKLRESKNEETDRKLAELRAKQRNSQTKRIEGRMITQAKARIRKNVETLNSMLAHGTENRHVPINMVRSTIEMLEAIDINTGNSKSLAKYLEKMENIYTGLKDAEAYAFDYDERTRQNIDNLKKLFADRNYTQLSLDELNQVVDITRALIQQIQNANKLMLKKKKADAVEFSREAIREVREAKHIDNAFMNGLDHYLTPHLNAFREFRKLSGYKDGRLMELYRDLDEGQLKQISVMRDINELFDDVLKNTKEVKNFTSTDEKDLVDSGLKDEKGNPVMITKAQRMSIIMHSYNDRNMEHIIYGGIRVPDHTKKDRKEALARAKIYFYVPPTDIRAAILGDDVERLDLITERATMKVKELEKQLSPWEKEFLAKVKEMFWHKTGGYINETSLKLKGYALARVGKYFPIPTDQNFIKKDIGNLVQDGTLEGKGFLKERKFGRNAIILEDITDTILRQTNDVAKYTGLAIPLRNLNMAWNTTVFTNAVADTLSNAVSNAWGKNNVDYISNLVVDLTSRRDGGDATFLDAMRGRFAGAVLTLNPSVSIKQAASYFTAGAIVGNRVLAKTAKDIGKGFFKKQGIAELEKINPLLWYRNQGNATQELADMKRTGFGKNLPIKVQKALNWVEFMDTGTVRTLEYAAKNYVDANFNLSGAEYWNKVSEVFTQIVEQTQPNYTPLQQADIIRNPNKALKLLVMFKTQPLQNMGVIYDAIGELKTRVKEGADTTEAKHKLIRAITSQVQSAMTFSMMTILANLLLHKFYKYKDDDDKFSWEKVLEEFGAGITKSFWGMLLFGQEVVDAFQSLLNGEKMNGLNVSFLDNIANLGNACMNFQKQTQKRLDAKTEADRQKYNNGILIYGGKVADYIGQIGGVPVGNIKNMIESLILYGLDVSEGEIGVSEISTKVDTQYERMYEALVANDRERYMKLFNEMVEVKTSDGKTQAEAEKSVNDSVKSYIKEGYAAGELTYEQAYTILTKDIGMSENDAYYKLDEWLYKSEGNDSYTKYSRMKDAIDEVIGGKVARTDIKTTITDLMKNGVSAETVRGQITKTYRQQYLELKSKNQASTLKSILLTAYMATGMTEDEANKKIDAWK